MPENLSTFPRETTHEAPITRVARRKVRNGGRFIQVREHTPWAYLVSFVGCEVVFVIAVDAELV